MTYVPPARLNALKQRYRASLSFYDAPLRTSLGLYAPTRPVIVRGSPTSAAKIRTLAGLGLNAQSSSAASGAQQGAAVGTAIFPGIGTAIGAVVGAVYGWVGGSQPSHAEQTWDSYKAHAGSGMLVAVADTDEAEIWKGAYDTNNAFFNLKGIKSRVQYVQWLVALLQQAMSDGRITPQSTARQIVDTIVYPAMKAAGSKVNDSEIMHGFLSDMVNRLFAGLPIHNERTQGQPLQPVTLAVPSSFATTASSATTSTAQNVPPSAPPVTAAQAPGGTTPIVPPQAASDATQLIQSMLAQNASSADAYTAALNNLSKNGVSVTPQVKQAVANEVQAQSTNYLPWILGGLGALALVYFMTSKRGRR